RGLPVIINSAYSSYKANFSSWLADDYVVKSPDLTELKDTIRKHTLK
ncbi:MAG: response regulator, partial [candidate division Zixibacteria bacterium]|nr:response regulator [candidate division Zixibacteria bacterium]